MAYTDLQLLRKMLSDPFKNGFDDIVADDESTEYKLSHHPVKESTVVVFVNNSQKTLTTDYTIDLEQGLVKFNTAPQAEDLIEVEYQYSVFSDEELQDFLDRDGSVDGAMIRCIEILLADSARRFDYSAGLTDVKADQVFQHLKDLLALYKGKVTSGTSRAKIVNRSHKAYGYNATNQDAYIGEESHRTPGDLSRDDL